MPKILIIEDDKFLLKLYSDKLRRGEYEVVTAISAEEGVNKAKVEKPDLIMLDLILPRKSGFEVLSEIKLNPEIKDIPVIILSNLSQEADKKRGLEMGAVAYLVKGDLSVSDLPQIVKEHLTKAKE